jgi:hypothetical protein
MEQEQDPNEQIVAAFQEEMAARNGKGKPVEIETTVAALRQFGQVVYNLKKSELSCNEKIIVTLVGLEDLLHQLMNQLNIYILEKELVAKGL